MKGPQYPTRLAPRPAGMKPKRPHPLKKLKRFVPAVAAIFVLAAGFFSLPLVLAVDVKLAEASREEEPLFPISVDPTTKTITTDPAIEELLRERPTQLPAAAGLAHKAFEKVALWVASLSAYQQLAGVAGAPNLFVKITPGQRQEQVAAAFGSKLGWTAAERKEFTAQARELSPDLVQGSTVPGIYFASVTDPEHVALLVNERFEAEIGSRYSTSTEELVPLEDALTIASLIEREAAGWHDMRLISGIMWNRIFKGMKLQIDATLQYAEANQKGGAGGWWPSVEPKDKYIKSPYNTYQNAGLPPGPIANPSIAAILAALNPMPTDCLFYFHDSRGRFHCSETYKGHVALLKKHYGQGR